MTASFRDFASTPSLVGKTPTLPSRGQNTTWGVADMHRGDEVRTSYQEVVRAGGEEELVCAQGAVRAGQGHVAQALRLGVGYKILLLILMRYQELLLKLYIIEKIVCSTNID